MASKTWQRWLSRSRVAPVSRSHLVDLGYAKHLRVNHGDDQFVDGHSHINGIESFWAYAKTRLARFHGVAEATFALHLKECEFRFNHRDQTLYLVLLKLCREHPLS